MSPKNHRNRATLADVAKLTGVSPKSISRVINGEPGVSEETRQRILAAVNELGYVANPIARRLRGTSNVIGLIVSGFEDYTGQVLSGISKATQKLNYNLVLYVQNTEGQPRENYLPLLASGLVGGVLMVVPYDYEILLNLCAEYELPYALVDYEGSAPAENVPTVTVTNRRGVLEAMRYLLALGHRRIGFITGTLAMASAQERLQGYRDALAEVGIPYDPALVMEGDFTQQTGFTQGRRLLELEPRPTAIVASDDLLAMGAMDAIKDTGLRVGEDVSVTGFDDIPIVSQVYPALTTIHQPMVEMGEAAVEMLVMLLQGQTPVNLHREFQTELIIRQSTGRPRA